MVVVVVVVVISYKVFMVPGWYRKANPQNDPKVKNNISIING